MATINTGPTPVNTGTTTTTIGPLDRSPGAVSYGVDPAIPTPTPQYYRPLDVSPGPVTPGVGLGINPGATPAAPIPVFEIPVQEPAPEGAGASVPVATPIYIKVLSDGTIVTENTLALNFLGTGVSIAADGSTANITITAGSGIPGGSNTQIQFNSSGTLGASANLTFNSSTNLLSVGGNVSATGNITGNYFIGNGSQLTGVTAGAAGGNGAVQFSANGVLSGASGFSYNTAANAMFVPTLTASGNSTTGINAIYGGVGGYVVLGSSVMAQFTGNVNAYSQVNLQNINSGNLASGDYILTANNGTDSTYYLDLGLAGSGHEDPDFFGDTSTANDGYLYVTGTDQAGPSNGVGNLILGSTNGVIKLFVGNTAQSNVIATVDSSGLNMSAPVIGDGNLYLQPDPANAGSYLDIYLTTGPDIHIAKNDSNVILGSDTGANVTVGTTGNVSIQANIGTAHVWTFDSAGQTLYPVQNIQRGDTTSGTISGYALVGGAGDQEFIISTPDGADNSNSQRLVINPGAGAGSGEGGDIYLWAGRGGNAGGSGGDIKIRGGQGGTGNSAGGYIRMEAGDANTVGGAAGYIDITGGFSNVAGGYVHIQGGGGNAAGGDANITGGYGYNGPGGNVNIIGGSSALGAGSYGNVIINTGNMGNTWTFDQNGNLTITYGSQIQEVASPVPGNYALALRGTGTVSADQQLLVYPTSLDANHLHLTSGNLYNTELFLGNDNLYVKLANTGNVVINTDDGVGNSAQWTFGANGNLTLPGNLIVPSNTAIIGQAASPAPTISGFGSINSVSISTSGNILTSGYISATGNVTGGNLLSGGLASVTGNVTGGNVLTGGLVSATANITGGNITTANLTSTGSLSITGNTATVTTANYSIGYLNIPQISLAANTTTALTDSGKHYYSTSAANLALTIANNTSVSWPVGTAITIVNRGTANITIAGGTGVSLYLSGNSTAGNRTVTTYGMATVMNVAANIWMINGTVV